jgi:hypothetical protein
MVFLFFEFIPTGIANDNTLHTDKGEVNFCADATLAIEIARPRAGYLYMGDRELVPLPSGNTIIVGRITVIARVTDAGTLKQVTFLVDEALKHTCYRSPYLWIWNARISGRGRHELKATATSIFEDQMHAWRNVTVLSLRRD